MSNACLIPFFKYEPSQRGGYKILFNYLLRHLPMWASEIDHLYLIDSGFGLTASDISKLKSIVPSTVYQLRADSHWANLNNYIPKIKEDKFLLIDSDTIIYNKDVVKNTFDLLNSNDIVSLTDGSGGDPLESKFSAFAANENRDKRRRFGPYYFACQTKVFEQIRPFDFTPTQGSEWTDSMGTVSSKLLALNPRFHEFPDDRSTLYYIDGKHEQIAFLDDSAFNWSKSTQNSYGYYHVRNFNGGLYLVETRALDPVSYNKARSIMPRQEAFRLLAWLWVMTEGTYHDEILQVVKDFETSELEFKNYISDFISFHGWLKDIK